MRDIDTVYEDNTEDLHTNLYADDLEEHECPICNAVYTSDWPFWTRVNCKQEVWVCCSECVEDFDIRKVEGK